MSTSTSSGTALTPPTKPTYWKSLAALERDPGVAAYLEHKVPEHAEIWGDGTSRRGFLQVMGASLAFAGVAGAGCRWEEDHIVPLAERPEGWVPGVPKKYATATELGGVGYALIATSYDGRPIKIDGNREAGSDGTTAYHQASILDLYDPDRSRAVARRQGDTAVAAGWSELEAFVTAKLAALAGGTGLRFLAEPSSSPTLAALQGSIATLLPGARWHEYEPIDRDAELAGTKLAFGAPHRARYALAGANVIAAFDCDLFFEHPDAVRLTAEWGARRVPSAGPMNRLYAFEPTFSLTGGKADHRLPVRGELIKPLLLALEAALTDSPAAAKALGAKILDDKFDDQRTIGDFVRLIAGDLAGNRGASLVCVGPRQPAEVHAVAARINAALGNAGATVTYTPVAERPSGVADLTALVADMAAGKVDTLVILGGNPVYDAPVDLDFAAALAKVPNSLHLSSHVDETSARVSWHLPRAHYLETWGDARASDGTILLAQPIVQPLYDGRSVIDVVKLFAGQAAARAEDLIQATVAGGASWRRAVHDGFVAGTARPTVTPAVAGFTTTPLTASQQLGVRGLANGGLELVLVPSSSTWDGRFANNAWLQETPDFLTKVTWDNCALVAPRTAAELGLKHEGRVTLTVEGRAVEAAVYVMPGQAQFSIGLALGYGRSRAGMVGGHHEGFGDGEVTSPGFDGYQLRTTKGGSLTSGLAVAKAAGHYPLASTQDHYDLDKKGVDATQHRIPELVKEATEQELRANPDVILEGIHTADTATLTRPSDAAANNLSLWQEHAYPVHKWGLAIDLTKCTGCNACVVACTAENNVPVVGKEQVIKNREMHWLRIDRYFKGDPDNPQLATQPVTCQQCENAPCEQVCPVGATIHSTEGLNDMVYNRCVGTRYCANNCPYKVRRFNFLRWDWYKQLDEARNKVRALLFNPEVTVRGRGVMEKCTYCVQRIQAAKIAAKNRLGDADRGHIPDGTITTACQDACGSDGIVFGDLSDPTSKVAVAHADKRAYALLAELNTKPRTVFLASIRNPHPELA